jgi:hypothetical protein
MNHDIDAIEFLRRLEHEISIKHLEQDDDDYEFIDRALDRWADRRFSNKNLAD